MENNFCQVFEKKTGLKKVDFDKCELKKRLIRDEVFLQVEEDKLNIPLIGALKNSERKVALKM